MADFEKSFRRVMRWESWVIENVAGDRGGLTCAGITKVYNPHWSGWAILDRNGMTLDDEVKKAVAAFYMSGYNAMHINEFVNQVVADQFYQAYINCGNAATRWMQGIIGVPVDGILGNLTLHGINITDPKTIVDAFFDRQTAYYIAIVDHDPTQKKFLAGWLARAIDFKWKS